MGMHKRYTPAERLAQDLFAARAIVTLDGSIWSDTSVEPSIAHDVRAHWPALVDMMERGSLWLCPTHEMHKPYWRIVDGRWLCLACKKLHKEVCVC